MACVADRNSRLDNDGRLSFLGFGNFLDLLYYAFYGRAVKEVLLGIVVGGSSDNDEISRLICTVAVCSGSKVKRSLALRGFFQVKLDVIILNR